MSCFVSQWEDSKWRELAAEVERAQKPPKRRAAATIVTVLCTVIPALALAGVSGLYDNDPTDDPVAVVVTETPVQTSRATPVQITVPTTVVAAPAPKPVYRGPRTCSQQDLRLYGGQVRVCARPATPIAQRQTSDLASQYR